MKRFDASIVFQTWDEAKQADDELRAAGYQTEVTDEADIYSQATWMRVSRASETDLWEQVEAIVDPLDGLIEEATCEDVNAENQ
jgi:hypothetical protein